MAPVEPLDRGQGEVLDVLKGRVTEFGAGVDNDLGLVLNGHLGKDC